MVDIGYVSIHAPVKDATIIHLSIIKQHNSFNPRTRKGCDYSALFCIYIPKVSIHAPVKDATHHHRHRHIPNQVSIHAPVKDATSVVTAVTSPTLVSIHAPVKDATRLFQAVKSHTGFNPRTRKGCDKELYIDLGMTSFQSTHP